MVTYKVSMDAVFKALADPTRRDLLDRLRAKDGQSLSELESALEMTRFGVMKHLGVLEEAQLITTHKVGRFKYHYLNAVPLQQVVDRWIEPLVAGPTARSLIGLKTQLEGNTMSKPDFISMTFIDCTHDALWEALTTGDVIAKFHFVSRDVDGDLNAEGDTMVFKLPDGSPMISNQVIAIDPKSRIEIAFQPHWAPDLESSRAVYLVEPGDSGMKLTVEHYDVPEGQDGVGEGWARFVSGLKTWLETGEAHRFAGPR